MADTLMRRLIEVIAEPLLGLSNEELQGLLISYKMETFSEEMKEAELNITHQEVRWGEIWAEALPGESWRSE